MNKKIMNKKGALVLRDIMFMMVIFSGILALASVFVINMASEYSNTDMHTEYYASDSIGNLGDEGLVNVSGTMNTLQSETGSSVGNWDLLSSMGTALKTVLGSPIYIGKALSQMMVALRIPKSISDIVGIVVIILIYGVIVFVIMSAFLRGGKV